MTRHTITEGAIVSDIERVAAVRGSRHPGMGPVPDLVDGGLTSAAHAIREANVERRVAAGERVAGFKVGYRIGAGEDGAS
jgi:2-keto-4-pentenoate hydratase